MFVNRKIRKNFNGEFFVGRVRWFDSRSKWYKIVYEDGDEEEMTEDEVRSNLIRSVKRKRRVESETESEFEEDEEEHDNEEKRRKKPRKYFTPIQPFLETLTNSKDILRVLTYQHDDSVKKLVETSGFEQLQSLLRNQTHRSSLDLEKQVILARHACDQLSTRDSKTYSKWKTMWLNVLRALSFESKTIRVMFQFVRSECEAYQDVCRVLGESYRPDDFHTIITDMFSETITTTTTATTKNQEEMRVILRVANFISSSSLLERLFQFALNRIKSSRHYISWIQFFLLNNNNDIAFSKLAFSTFLKCIPESNKVVARALMGISASSIYMQHVKSASQKCYDVPHLIENILNVDIHAAKANKPDVNSSDIITTNSSQLMLRHRHRRRLDSKKRKLKDIREHRTHILNIVTHMMYLQCQEQQQHDIVSKTQSVVMRWWMKIIQEDENDDERKEGQDIVKILLLHPDQHVDSMPVESYILSSLWARARKRSYFLEILESIVIRSLRYDSQHLLDFGTTQCDLEGYLKVVATAITPQTSEKQCWRARILVLLLGASNERLANWIERHARAYDEWAMDMVTLVLTTTTTTTEGSGEIMTKSLPDVVTKYLKYVLQDTNIGTQYRSRTSLSKFVCSSIFVRFSKHDDVNLHRYMNEWLVSFAQSRSVLEDLVSVMSDLDAFACLPSVLDSVISNDVRQVLREDLSRRLENIDQDTLEQVLERVAFGEDFQIFFRVFEDEEGEEENKSSWIRKVWSLVPNEDKDAKNEVLYLLVMSIVRRRTAEDALMDLCILIRISGYSIAALWCLCRLFALDRLDVTKLNKDTELMLCNTMIRGVSENDLKHFDIQTQIRGVYGVVMMCVSSHTCKRTGIFMKVVGHLASRDSEAKTWFPLLCNYINCETCLMSLFRNVDLGVLFKTLVMNLNLRVNTARALISFLDNVVSRDSNSIRIVVRLMANNLRFLAAHLTMHRRSISFPSNALSVESWLLEEEKKLSEDEEGEKEEVKQKDEYKLMFEEDKEKEQKRLTTTTTTKAPIKRLLISLDRAALDQTALERAIILIERMRPDIAISVVMPVIIVLLRQILSLAHNSNNNIKKSWTQQVSRVVRLVRCLDFNILENKVLCNQFFDLIFIFFDMFDTKSSLNAHVTSCFRSIGLMLYEFVSTCSEDLVQCIRLKKDGKRVGQLGRIVMKWNFQSFSETLVVLSGMKKKQFDDYNDDDDDDDEKKKHNVELAKKWILDRSDIEGETNHMKESWQMKALIRLEALSLRNKHILVPFLSDLLDIAGGPVEKSRDLALLLLQRLYVQQEKARQDILSGMGTLLEDLPDTTIIQSVSEYFLLRCASEETFQKLFISLFEYESENTGKTIQSFLSLLLSS